MRIKLMYSKAIKLKVDLHAKFKRDKFLFHDGNKHCCQHNVAKLMDGQQNRHIHLVTLFTN